MPNPMITIHNSETNEIIEREMNAEEFALYTARNKEMEAHKAEAEAKATARASALAKLAALGLSADEIAAL
jgi:DNA-binding NarL/FixJ family response regulator